MKVAWVLGDDQLKLLIDARPHGTMVVAPEFFFGQRGDAFPGRLPELAQLLGLFVTPFQAETRAPGCYGVSNESTAPCFRLDLWCEHWRTAEVFDSWWQNRKPNPDDPFSIRGSRRVVYRGNVFACLNFIHERFTQWDAALRLGGEGESLQYLNTPTATERGR